MTQRLKETNEEQSSWLEVNQVRAPHLYWAWKCSCTKLCRSRGCWGLAELGLEVSSNEACPCRRRDKERAGTWITSMDTQIHIMAPDRLFACFLATTVSPSHREGEGEERRLQSATTPPDAAISCTPANTQTLKTAVKLLPFFTQRYRCSPRTCRVFAF